MVGGIIASVRQQIDTLARTRPESAPWLARYEAALRLADDPVWDEVTAGLRLAPDRLSVAPLLAGATLELPAGLAERTVRAVLASAGEGEGPEATALMVLTDAHHLPALDLIAAAIAQDIDQIDALAIGLGVDPDALAVVAHLAALPLLLACGRRLSARIPARWRAGSCPICGAWPAAAEVRGLERARHLRCGRCGGDWVQTAAGCLYCGTTDHEQLGSLVPETNAEAHRVETCTQCRGYVKTIATIRPWTPGGVALADLASVELDLAALEHDYTRPAGPAFDLELRLTEAPRQGRA